MSSDILPPTTIIGMDDGGAGIRFPDHPAHHRDGEGMVQVTFSRDTLGRMVLLAARALDRGEYLEETLPEYHDE